MPHRPPPTATAVRALGALALLAATGPGRAEPPAARSSEVLHQLNGAVAGLAAKVSPAVVQIEVSGYGLAGESRREESGFVARQRGIGSGVIVDPAGYIVTNHHVVKGAQRITVILASPPGRPPSGADAASRRMLAARLVGADPGADLALLKVEGSGLAHIPVDPAVKVRQGELVFAVGSPQGLSSTITMGVVGSPGREVPFAQPIAYIQTDAPINPGNSGGPLVNVDGALVGINSFIVTQSGGSQGLGFAIPAGVVKAVTDSLRTSGRVRRIDTGVTCQSITPALAMGLGLPRDWGVVVADVTLAGAARRAGVQVGDVIDTFDGHAIDSLATLTSALYLHAPGKPVNLGVLRGAERLALEVQAPEARQPADELVELANPEKGMVRRLGIVALDVSPKLAGIIPPLLVARGVVVAARTLDSTSAESGLQSGDVIHALNRTEVDSVEGLRKALRGVEPGAPVALQIERAGKLAWLAIELD
jgi:serine protease Do